MNRLGFLYMGLLVVALVAGCGGGGGDDPTPGTVTLTSEPSLDGYAAPTGMTIDTETALIGDNSANEMYKAFVSFARTPIPAGATIDSATLRLYQADTGNNSYARLGAVYVEHVNYGTDADDAYNAVTLHTVGGTLADVFSVGWHEIDVTGSVQDDITNGRAYSQFRFRHLASTYTDGIPDTDPWCMGDSATNKPQLVVVYH